MASDFKRSCAGRDFEPRRRVDLVEAEFSPDLVLNSSSSVSACSAADDFAAEADEHRSRVEPVRESAEPAFEVRVGRDENMFLTTTSSPNPRSSARADALMSVTFEAPIADDAAT